MTTRTPISVATAIADAHSTKAVRLAQSRLDRAQRLYLTKPFDRRRLKRAMRIRRLVIGGTSRQALQALGTIQRAVRACMEATDQATSAFEAFGKSLALVPPDVMTDHPPCEFIARRD